jgi:hypothetical protein
MSSRRILARLGVGAATVALASAPLAAMAAATNAGPHTTSCTNMGCNGKDPQATGCSSTFQARSIRTAPIVANGRTVGWIELRWSPHCGNNWARVVSASGSQALAATATRADNAMQSAKGAGTVLWTPMIFGRDLCVKATGWIGSATATTPCA